MAHIQVNPYILQSLNHKIADEHKKMLYRPTAVGLVQSPAGLLMTEAPAKTGNYWSFPQGGVHKDEGVTHGLLRELWEEVAIRSAWVVVRKFCFAHQVDIPNWEHDGFTRGKSYYYFHLVAERSVRIRPDFREVASFKWAAPEEAQDAIFALRDRWEMREKADGMLCALNTALRP